MQIRNITFDAGTAEMDIAPSPVRQDPPQEHTLRLRTVAVSPHEEYALRDGDVRPISNELASAILSRKGRVELTLRGVVIDRKDMGGRFRYHHPDSRLCNDLSLRERKHFYVVNPLAPETVHILDDAGCYLESLPLAERPEVLNVEQQARVAAGHKRQIGRLATHLQNLHAEDTRDALEQLAATSSEMQRVVQVMPSPAASNVEPSPPESLSVSRFAEVNRQTSIRVTREQAAGTPSDVVRRRARKAECPF
jgi:hypothetical protein